MKIKNKKYIVIAVISLLIILGGVAWLLFSKNSPNATIIKDPAGVVLGLGDLPQDWSITFDEYYSPPDTYAKKYHECGFENGFEREFKKGTAYLMSWAERFSTAEGAKEAYEYWQSVANTMVSYGYAAPVEHDTVGDQSFLFQGFNTSHVCNGCSARFKKSNFLVHVDYSIDNVGELTISDALGYLQTSEGRLH